MSFLQLLLNGVALAMNQVLTEAVAVNNKGQIAANGVVNGHTHAYLLTPGAAVLQ